MPAIGFAAADIGAAADVGAAAADIGGLGVLDAGLVGGAVPGAIAGDVLGAGAADALVAGGADLGLGAAGFGDLAAGADVGAGALDFGATGALGADALSAMGGGADVLGPGLNAPSVAADVSLTPGATTTGLGAGALGGPTGATVGAGQELGLMADPTDLLAVSSGGGPGGITAGDQAATGLAANAPGNVLGGGLPSLPAPVAAPDVPGTFGQTPLLAGPSDTSGFIPAATGSPVAAAAVPAAPAGGGLGAGTAGVLGDIGSSMDTALTAMPPEELAGGPGAAGGGGGGLFGTGISGKDAAMYGLAGAPLAMALLKGEPGVPPQANQATALSPQEQALASEMMTSVQQNRPTASQAAVVAQNSQNRLNAYRQMLFNQGVQNPEADSRWPALVAQDQQQQLVETQQFMKQNMADAMAAAGGAQSGLLSVAQLQAQQDAAYTQALQNAMRSAGTVLALGGGFGNKPVTPALSI
jgi:hypothetical protein